MKWENRLSLRGPRSSILLCRAESHLADHRFGSWVDLKCTSHVPAQDELEAWGEGLSAWGDPVEGICVCVCTHAWVWWKKWKNEKIIKQASATGSIDVCVFYLKLQNPKWLYPDFRWFIFSHTHLQQCWMTQRKEMEFCLSSYLQDLSTQQRKMIHLLQRWSEISKSFGSSAGLNRNEFNIPLILWRKRTPAETGPGYSLLSTQENLSH